MFTHMMPYLSYSSPSSCGPDQTICCQFDFARIGGMYDTQCGEWEAPAVKITEENVATKSMLWLKQVQRKADLYNTGHVLVPLGDDFRYTSIDEVRVLLCTLQLSNCIYRKY